MEIVQTLSSSRKARLTCILQVMGGIEFELPDRIKYTLYSGGRSHSIRMGSIDQRNDNSNRFVLSHMRVITAIVNQV